MKLKMLISLCYSWLLLVPLFGVCQINHNQENNHEVQVPEDEYWWGGLSVDGIEMPYSAETSLIRDLFGNTAGNQGQPLLVSNKGRYIWSEEPFSYEFKKGNLTVAGQGKIIAGQSGNSLKEAFLYASSNFFPSDGEMPAELMFSAPQYNTWIELMYNQNEKDILKYARAIIDNGYPPGVLMIDDNWQVDYGDWDFSLKRFSDPKGMVKKLHQMGFKVMLWVCPFVSPDSETFRYLQKEGLLIRDKQGNAAIVRWWNGASAVLDFSNPGAVKWFKNELDALMNDYGVDGFKFDAGDADFYTDDMVSFNPTIPNGHSENFARIGLDYPLNEYRACWKMAGQPLVQRLRDKKHEWEDLQQLMPGMTALGLMGYAYSCPDMIGGGEFTSFLDGNSIDEELVVRSAQVHALMPMMQFSVAPWRVLNKENQAICREMALLHAQMSGYILQLARKSAKTGEPIVRPMAYNCPDGNYEQVKDQFFLGDSILVAPVLKKGARSRKVVLPHGVWEDWNGNKIQGARTIQVEAKLNELPFFKCLNLQLTN
jgi:alpha-glucosidase (family GH31 glycosyl hydrolase)